MTDRRYNNEETNKIWPGEIHVRVNRPSQIIGVIFEVPNANRSLSAVLGRIWKSMKRNRFYGRMNCKSRTKTKMSMFSLR